MVQMVGRKQADGPQVTEAQLPWPSRGGSTFRSCDRVSRTSGGPTSRPSSRPVALFLYVTLPRYRMAERTEKILGEQRSLCWGRFQSWKTTEASSQLG